MKYIVIMIMLSGCSAASNLAMGITVNAIGNILGDKIEKVIDKDKTDKKQQED